MKYICSYTYIFEVYFFFYTKEKQNVTVLKKKKQQNLGEVLLSF